MTTPNLDPPPKFNGVDPQDTSNWTQLYRWLNQLFTYLTAVLSPTPMINKSFSFNFDFTSVGIPPAGGSPGPGAPWGTGMFADSPITFLNVPAGMQVQLLRYVGSCAAQFTSGGNAPYVPVPGSSAGFLVGLITKAALQPDGSYLANTAESPYVDAATDAQDGCPLFLLDAIDYAKPSESIQFDVDLSTNENAILDGANTLLVREAFYLNNSGLNIHIEVSGTIEFQYIAAS